MRRQGLKHYTSTSVGKPHTVWLQGISGVDAEPSKSQKKMAGGGPGAFPGASLNRKNLWRMVQKRRLLLRAGAMEVTSTTLIGQTQTRLRLAHGAGGLGAIFKVAKPARQRHMVDVAHLYY
jgi:hypothetical protein